MNVTKSKHSLKNRSFVFHAANWGSTSKGIPLEKDALDTRHL